MDTQVYFTRDRRPHLPYNDVKTGVAVVEIVRFEMYFRLAGMGKAQHIYGRSWQSWERGTDPPSARMRNHISRHSRENQSGILLSDFGGDFSKKQRFGGEIVIMVDTTYLAAVVVLVLGISVEQGVAVTTERRTISEGQPVEFPCDLLYDSEKDFYWVKVKVEPHVLKVILKRNADSPFDEFELIGQYKNRTDISLTGPNSTTLRLTVRREDEAINGVYIECQLQQPQGDLRKTRYELVVTYPPDPPTDLTLSRTPEDLTASCTAGQSYRGSQRVCIEYLQHGTSTWKDGPCYSAVEDGRTLQFEVNDLDSTQSYNVCCIASDAYGEKSTCQNTGPLKSTGLSVGEIAAICTCVAVVVLILLVVGIVCCCRKYKGNGEGCKIPCPCPCGKGGDEHDQQEGAEMQENPVQVAGQGNNLLNAAPTGK
ncbi:Hypp7901 [Branchiostoma lanceolatum]|uniref:Hypp7901 protein n=1 Tax=Branchiostoma lanceolatum TaxID=7740 RepID=A0A8J9Z462_BRALA|nr:Hypp7901 [Branchiostoma lanceolatum]